MIVEQDPHHVRAYPPVLCHTAAGGCKGTIGGLQMSYSGHGVFILSTVEWHIYAYVCVYVHDEASDFVFSCGKGFRILLCVLGGRTSTGYNNLRSHQFVQRNWYYTLQG